MKPVNPVPRAASGAGEDTRIPDKLYFRIGEVAQLAGVEPYVLRFWESEFPQLHPKKSGTGHRLYRRKEVELILEVKHLLYEKRFTIEGARLFFEQRKKKGGVKVASVRPETPPSPPEQVGLFAEPVPPVKIPQEIRREVEEILRLLS
jgi:DNA-binding transcriptional MerR regulator